MKFTLTIDTDNAAFEEDKGQEIARILEQTARRIVTRPTLGGNDVEAFSFAVQDANGVTVGRAELLHEAVVWVRVGDADNYQQFDTPAEAGQHVAERLTAHGDYDPDGGIKSGDVARYYGRALMGVVIHATPFVGNNGVSLFWGDADAQIDRGLTDAEIAAFADALEAAVQEEREEYR